jgi:hypothetical protein
MPKNVLITPANGTVEFSNSNSVLSAKLDMDNTGNFTITNSGGNLTIGDSSALVYIGDGVNSTDVVFEQNGAIRAAAGKTLTVGASTSNVSFSGNMTSNALTRFNLGSTAVPTTTFQVNYTNVTTAMTGTGAYGGIHLIQNAGNDGFIGITTDATSTGTQAGIMFQGSGSYGTKIHFLTASSYAAGMAQRVIIDHNGNIGVGTTSPNAKLDVRGSVIFNEDGGNIDFRVEGDTDTALLFTDASADAVGIGTTGPLAKLDVVSAAATHRARIRNSSTGEAVLLFQNSDSGTGTGDGLYVGIDASENAWVWNNENKNLSLGTNNTERVTITAAGNIGVKTTSPQFHFHVNGSLFSNTFQERITTATLTASTYTGNLTGSNVFDLTARFSSTAITFTNAPISGNSFGITLIIRQPGTAANTVTFANTVYWSNGEVPTLSSGIANKADIITLMTVNGGSTFFGAHAMANVG